MSNATWTIAKMCSLRLCCLSNFTEQEKLYGFLHFLGNLAIVRQRTNRSLLVAKFGKDVQRIGFVDAY